MTTSVFDRAVNFMLNDGGVFEISLALCAFNFFLILSLSFYLKDKLEQIKRIKARFRQEAIPKSFFTRWEKEKTKGDYKINDASID